MQDLNIKLFIYIVIIFSSIIHEYFHAWAAFILGDKTAKDAGRLTLNPIPHIDPIGTIIIPFILLISVGGFIGWAKPVPYNPYNLKNQKWGRTIVALAGPVSNLFIALVLGIIIRLSLFPALVYPFSAIVFVNIFLALFNLIPVPPLDGSKLIFDLFPKSEALFQKTRWGIMFAVLIGITILPYEARWIFTVFVGNLL
jgi:Zn-dependent protease